MKRYSLGEQLRAARIKKELSLYDVEKVSGVEAQYLLAMEMDQLKALPKDIQQEALEKYATSVDLDGKHLYEEQKKNERKVKEEKKQVEDLVNEYIKQDLKVERLEMTKEEALKLGAEAMFLDKYGDEVTVYKIGDVSMEFCGGPHVERTGVLGTFKIKKEEASSSGVRRIKAILL